VYGGVKVQLHAFLTSALVGDERWASRSGRFATVDRTSHTHWLGGGVSPGVGVEAVAIRVPAGSQTDVVQSVVTSCIH
jgi:hypothetical protein